MFEFEKPKASIEESSVISILQIDELAFITV